MIIIIIITDAVKPVDENIRNKEQEKINKYQDIARENKRAGKPIHRNWKRLECVNQDHPNGRWYTWKCDRQTRTVSEGNICNNKN